ncbi:MAG: hypothetical protein LUF78_13970 [Clostridiales bacterium]|nr:hypothetical protein [Clostridiales bacterium]
MKKNWKKQKKTEKDLKSEESREPKEGEDGKNDAVPGEMDEAAPAEPDESVLNPKTVNEADLTRKERRLLEKEKLKDMTVKERLAYIWMYYKPEMAGVLVVILLIYLGVTIYQGTRINTLLTIAVTDCYVDSTQELEEEILEILGSTGKYDEVTVTQNFVTNETGDGFDYYVQMAFVTQVAAGTLDVMVMSESLYEGIFDDERFADLREILGDELYESFGDSIDTWHLTLTDSALAEELSLTYDPICISVIANTENADNVAAWIASLADQE